MRIQKPIVLWVLLSNQRGHNSLIVLLGLGSQVGFRGLGRGDRSDRVEGVLCDWVLGV